MICKSCNKENPNSNKYCEFCGSSFIIETKPAPQELKKENDDSEEIDKKISPFPYYISVKKLVVMSLGTLGLYVFYWFYMQWKSVNELNSLKHGKFALIILSFFSTLTSYWLFKNISKTVKKDTNDDGIEAAGLAAIYFLLSIFYIGFFALIPAQKKLNYLWDHRYRNRIVKSSFGAWNAITITILLILFVFLFYSNEQSTYQDFATITGPNSLFENTISTDDPFYVVNILCTDIESGEEYGGSGTIFTEDGLILTNSHIVPQTSDGIMVGDEGCIVTIPDKNTGKPAEIYFAEPYVYEDLSEEYDLAFFEITKPYVDSEGISYGEFPKKFASIDNSVCTDEPLSLGEKIIIYGYPVVTGGFNLTVTDGVVSSFADDGSIYTSAKIDSGNSGGMAVDSDGCFLGVPSAVMSGNFENYGVIISNEIISNFFQEVLPDN